MGLFESIFDLTYLVLVIGLGLRLVLLENKEARLFGWMAVILGSGDAFHLIPRVIAHLSPLGFEGYQGALSWGKFVTGITMTIFYVLFYFYYRSRSGDTDKKKQGAILLLAGLRILLILLPQNNWGTANESYSMGILRNIPFAILGFLLVYWTYKERKVEGLERMSLLIFLSFLFYIPVVLGSEKIPALGALMLPKTVAYIFIVVQGFQFFISDFKRDNFLDQGINYLLMGLVAGVFYREFTKYYGFTGVTHLAKVHVHTLVLGFILSLLLFLLVGHFAKENIVALKKPFHVYNTGLVLTLSSMTLYGIFDVVREGQETVSIPALSGISGLGHIFLGVGLVWLMVSLRKARQGLRIKEA